jgi:GntR family transcriptional regulator
MPLSFRELAATLREAIVTGQYPMGTTLPRQRDLAETHGVNVKTVQSAVKLLESEGLVTVVRRRGTVVRERTKGRLLGVGRYAKHEWKFQDAIDRQVVEQAGELDPSGRRQSVRLMEADEFIANGLEVQEGELVLERARVGVESGKPTQLLKSYHRQRDVAGTPLDGRISGPAEPIGGFKMLTLNGLEPQRIDETLSSRMPSPEEAGVLGLAPGEPVMIVDRKTRINDGRVVEFAHGIYASSHFTWRYSFPVPD